MLSWGAPEGDVLIFVFWTWIVLLILVAFACLARRQIGVVPTGWAGAFEHVYHWIADLAQGMMGPIGVRYVPLCMTIFLFVLASNWLVLLPTFTMDFKDHPLLVGGYEFLEVGIEAPTATVYTTLAMAIIAFLSFTFYGMARHHEVVRAGDHPGDHGGHGSGELSMPVALVKGFISWLGHFIQPTPSLWRSLEGGMKALVIPLFFLFVFLNVVEELARLISLSMRLFGNIFGEHMVKVSLFTVILLLGARMMDSAHLASIAGVLGNGGLSLMLWATSLFVTILGALAGFIQAFIFMILTLSYIAHVVTLEH